MTPAVSTFAVAIAGMYFLVYTDHYVFASLTFALAALMVTAMIAGGGK